MSVVPAVRPGTSLESAKLITYLEILISSHKSEVQRSKKKQIEGVKKQNKRSKFFTGTLYPHLKNRKKVGM